MLSCQIAAEHFDFNHHEVIPQYAPWAYFILRQQYFTFPQEIFHFPVRENFIGYWGCKAVLDKGSYCSL
jgi:hypothetical protein